MDRPKVEIQKPGKGFSRVTVTFTEDARTTALNCAARLRRAASLAHGDPPQGVDPGVLDFEAGVLERLADRLEAAAERDKQDAMKTALMAKCEICARLVPQGNAAAMREALIKIYHEIRSYCYDYGDGESHKSLIDRIMDSPPDYTSYEKSILEIDSIVESALSAPPRNCDVGTAEEQWDRYTMFCATHSYCCQCPVKPLWNFEKGRKPSCGLLWAQMPYEAEGGAE